MKITYFGHSSFSVEINGLNILFDPFISGNPAAKHVNVDSIPADFILISHGHLDHVLDVEAIAKRTGAKLIGPFEVIEWFGKKGLTNTHDMNHGGQFTFDFGTVKCVNAVHSSSMPDGSYGGNPVGFVITPQGSRKSFYYSGDTALTYDMRLIGEDYEVAVALLPIGDNYTMGIHDAVRCAEFVGTHTVVGLHYDTFPPIQINKDEAVASFRKTGKNLLLPKIGETILIDQ